MFTATEAVPVAKVVAGNKRYPGVVALDNVNFTLNKGEVRALLGKNGAGKSTLIRMLTGSERPDSGDIWIGETRLEGDEATLTRRAAELGVRAVYQELSLVEGLTVAENLCLGQWPRRNGMIDHQFNFRTGKRAGGFIKNDHARLALHHPRNFHQLLLRRA